MEGSPHHSYYENLTESVANDVSKETLIEFRNKLYSENKKNKK